MGIFFSGKNPALFILEAGVNHDGDFQKAKELIKAAAQTGADFIKFQTYTASRLAAKNSPSYWNLEEEPTTSQIELFSKYDGFDTEDYIALASYAKDCGIGFMTTCFDEIWVEELDQIIPIYKIASADITNFGLIKHIASKNKPIILSTGAASFIEIRAAVEVIKQESEQEICLMHCVLNYPTEYENANLNRISNLAREFSQITIGYSDHTRPEISKLAIQTAYTLGARVFEKHFTLNKLLQGNDHYHSFNVQDCRTQIDGLRTLESMSKYLEEGFIEIQSAARQFARRGLYASRPLMKGHIVTESDLIALRPTYRPRGVDADSLSILLNRSLATDHEAGQPITLDSINNHSN
jgi:N-acetylneuraminate synthase